MDVANELGYKPPSDFVEDKRDPLVELKVTDSTELWLIQWPLNHSSDFDGQVSLKLDNDGHLGSFESSSGKSYDVFNLKAQDPVGTVFLSSASEAKAVGKISRHVSFIHYPEPSEFQKHNKMSLKEIAQRSSTMTKTSSVFHPSSGTKSSKHKTSQSTSMYTTNTTPSSQQKSSKSKLGEPSKTLKKRSKSMDQDSGRGNSAVTTSGSAGHSQERKAKKLKAN
ncbi:PREDICTED: mediator-associated protein 2-like [Ipomoea nil]|uniref:mediator-associated protein 2-like n=1 Tax=Ipomoea nil TaxID=35883 RepID=UPI000901B464|nr:PREDICTED: mediator-associated protein 2-like [Ipomoea nil]XP_019193269.1 PREDICTED: mediator-associated protein 2-like [Ipomoea nil]